MPRPKQTQPRPALTSEEIDAARYVGSCEHKAKRWWGGLPCIRIGRNGIAKRSKKLLTTICPLITEDGRLTATRWVREALAQRQQKYYDGDKIYPKHIWYREEDGRYWFGFCLNGISGEYKGWPVDEVEKVEKFG